MVERHPYTVDTGVQFSNEVPSFIGRSKMDMDSAAVWLAGSILVMLGFIVVIAGFIVVNNMIHKYWKPVRIFTADSFQPFNHVPMRYATEEEELKELDTQRKK